jgi:hypothetical protein
MTAQACFCLGIRFDVAQKLPRAAKKIPFKIKHLKITHWEKK